MFYQLLSTTDEGKGIYRAIFELNDAGINGYLPIACTTNDEDICFALREGECQVWIAHGIYENQIRVDATFSVIANDFASFVDAISQPEDVYCALEQLGISGTSADAEDFFQAGGTLNQLDKYDRTLLTVAIINGNVSVAEVCLRCGASTVGTIHSAVQAHQTEMIDLLLRYGASVNELDDCGYAPITYVGGTSLPGEDGERNRKLLEKLREFGAV